MKPSAGVNPSAARPHSLSSYWTITALKNSARPFSRLLERETPRVSSVAYILNQRRRSQRLRALRPVQLYRRPDLTDLHVQPHNPEVYDELSETDD